MAGFVSGPELAPRRRQQEVYQAPPAPKPLNVVLACWKGDQDQAVRLLQWIAELGMVQAPFYLLCDNQCNYEYLLELARKAFSKVEWLEDKERVETNWHQPGDHPKSAAGPNSLFRQCAWHFMLRKLGPWLFLEPDAIPCKRDWYNVLEREYQIGAKPFMGYKVTPVNHPGVPQHMSGVAIYHEQTPSLAPLASNAGEVAFDIAGVTETCKDERTWFTQTIFHKYRAPSFLTEEDFNSRVIEPIALYHSNKDGSIIPWLRKRLGITPKEEEKQFWRQVIQDASQPVNREVMEEIIKAKAPDLLIPQCDIFIKTWERDYPWLEWCLKSIDTFQADFNSVQVLTDSGWDFGTNKANNLYTIATKPKEPGYLWQQVCKLYADEHMGFKDDYEANDFILFMDSDCVFTREVTPSDFIKDGKPIWLYTPLDKARPDQHVWAPVMEKFLGKKPEHEFMRRHPFIVQRWMLEEFRKFTQYRHGKSLEDYIMGEADPQNALSLRFSEWNCLGFFLWEYHRDRVEWVLDGEAGEAVCYQGYTHGGESRKAEDIAKFRELLGENPEGLGVVPRGGGGMGSPALTISKAIEFIASQVSSNVEKARIIHQLKTAWKGRGSAGTRKKAISEQLESNYEHEGTLTGGTGLPRLQKQRSGKKVSAGSKQVVEQPYRTPHRTLLCIHSYPGGNETFARHWPNFQKAGADRIVGIGTTDGKCRFGDSLDPLCESVNIGENSYMKLKGKDDHLCRRLLDTVKWCLTQPEDHFIIAEYDTVFLKKLPHFKGINASLTGGKVNGSKTSSFYHNPHCFDRETGPELVAAMEAVLPDSAEYPDNSPDLFFGLACERAGIKVGCNFKLFTRNSLDHPGDLDLAVEAALDGVHVIHGVKTEEEYHTIMRALNEKHLSMSHAA